ncbi:MAG TPA: UDP-N-acetylmuramoyl-L-alanyl-D-glutamate--2,6-diaminopimelate ligase [Candidatus Scatovivens faecipullorum]|nr:UDP-N-acetylmuramoyl-L-alanyl-D-glutamate--2,6-diaminopimelate ligase [Candidatus Scatovivens faecipullorum]
MELKKLLLGIENFKSKGDMQLDIKKVASNSKKVVPNSLFVAIKGYDFDGHEYIEEAVKNGAVAVMLDMSADFKKINIPKGITVIITDDTRKALARVSCNFFGNPSRYFKLIGVTGTKGKTTTTYMIKSILEKAGYKVGLIGTIANYIGEDCLGFSDRTTPESIELQELFYKMARQKVDYVVMEVSSQSLKLNRVEGTNFDYAIFTNLYKDHISLKEHTDMNEYFESKLKLFQMTPKGFVNSDDFKCNKIINGAKNCDIKTYAVDNKADLLAKDITITNISVDFKVKLGNKNERIKVNIPGRYSVYNALAAISFANSIGIDAEKIKEGLENIVVPGRNELVPNKEELAIMIDYAHTAESLENILQATKTYTPGRVICVFGCGGDRDKEKRPRMGEVAGRLADYSIVTSDNPRTEKPEDIIAQIEKGIAKTKGKYEVIVDRKKAIEKAIKMMNKRDIVILAGKGHEVYQEINGEKRPFDERQIVKEILGEKK